MSLDDLMLKMKARGNFGHEGRPGKRGGSLPKGGGGASTTQTSGKSPTSVKDIHNKLKKLIPEGDPYSMNSSIMGGWNTGWDGDHREKIGSHLSDMGFSKKFSSDNGTLKPGRGKKADVWENDRFAVHVTSSKVGTDLRVDDKGKMKKQRDEAFGHLGIYD